MCDDFELRKTHTSSIVEGEELVRDNAAVVAGVPVFASEAPTARLGRSAACMPAA
jgi:hypothetical protein